MIPYRKYTHLVIGCLCLTGAMIQAKTVFDVELTSRAQQLQAGEARGESQTVEAPSALNYEEDMVAHSGVWGLRLENGQRVGFLSKENWPNTWGTAAVRLRAESLEGTPTVLSVELANGEELQLQITEDRQLHLVHFSATGNTQLLASPNAGTQEDTLDLGLGWSAERDHLWLFVNGKNVAAIELSTPLEWGTHFYLGTRHRSPAGAITLSALRISESAPGYTALAHTLQQETDTAPSLPMAGAPTPWFEEGMPKLAMEALDPDVVLPPWEPVTWDGSAAGVWNRSYEFQSPSLISQITSVGDGLLSEGGIQVQVREQGNPHTITFQPAKPLSEHQGQLVLEKSSQSPFIDSKIQVEYDGMVWLELNVRPENKESLQEIVLQIPIRAEYAEYYNHIGAPRRYESQNLRRNSYSDRLPDQGKMSLPFKTAVWIGNTHAGLMWFAESDENWWPLDRQNSIEFERLADGSGLLNIRLVAEHLPENAPETLTYRFGLVATPVKPMPEGWRSWSLSAQYDSHTGTTRGSHLIYWPDEWRSMYLDPEPTRALNPERTRKKVKQDRAQGRKIIPYWTRIHMPISDGKSINPDGERMRELFAVEPDRPAGSTHNMIRVSSSSGWADYLIWAYDRWNSWLGEVDGWYLDETQPIPNTREASGGGYQAWDGSRRATFEFLASRDLMKRMIYHTVHEFGKDPAFVIHNSSTYALPYMNFYQIFFTGEQFNSGYFIPNPEVLPPAEDRVYYYSYVLPMNRLIVEGFWRQWGIPISWFAQFKNQDKDLIDNRTSARDFLSRVIQIDAIYWPLFMYRNDLYAFQRIRREFGITDADVTFTPYWENNLVVGNPDEVVCGYYENSKGWLLLCSNLSRVPQEARISLENLQGHGRILNAETGEEIRVNDNGFLLNLPRNDYILVQIYKKE